MLPVDKLSSSRPLPENIKLTHKYKQIVLSIKELGIIEPVAICILDSGKHLKILDGHLRVEAFKDLGMKEVPCIISADEESYTYNKHVNRLSVIQEQRMLQIAVASGVPEDMLISILGISRSTLTARFRLLDGVCEEVIALLAEKQVPRSFFHVLKKMKPSRQIDAVNIMLSLNNLTRKFALSLLHATPENQLVDDKKLDIDKRDHKANLERLEREMAAVQIETEKLSEDYAANTLKLVIIKGHIGKLLNNARVLHWLMDHNQDFLLQLRKISEIHSLH